MVSQLVKKRLAFCTQHCAGDKIERNEMDGVCSSDGERRGVYRVLVGKFWGKTPMGRPRRRWEDNIKMGLQEVRCVGMDWIELAQDRDNTFECGNEP
jgi:hypothetical protein